MHVQCAAVLMRVPCIAYAHVQVIGENSSRSDQTENYFSYKTNNGSCSMCTQTRGAHGWNGSCHFACACVCATHAARRRWGAQGACVRAERVGRRRGHAKGAVRCSLHNACMPHASRHTAFSPGSVCMAHMQEPRASLGKEGVPQGQDLPGGKRCEVEVLHELIGACEHGQVCTVDAILLQDARESTCVPAFEE